MFDVFQHFAGDEGGGVKLFATMHHAMAHGNNGLTQAVLLQNSQ